VLVNLLIFPVKVSYSNPLLSNLSKKLSLVSFVVLLLAVIVSFYFVVLTVFATSLALTITLKVEDVSGTPSILAIIVT
jgi:hypothetical protein